MKTNTRVTREIVVTTPDEVGVLSRISTIISETKVNISAICAYEVDNVAHLRLITDDNQKAVTALQRAGFDAVQNDVILAEVSPHSIHPEADVLAGDVKTGNNYWCASSHSGEHAVVIFPLKDSARMSMIR